MLVTTVLSRISCWAVKESGFIYALIPDPVPATLGDESVRQESDNVDENWENVQGLG